MGNIIWFYLLRKYPLSKVTPFALLIPVFGCIITAIVLDEEFDLTTIFGGVVTLLGVAFIVLGKIDENKI